MRLTSEELAAEFVELQAEQKLIADRMDDIKSLLGPGKHSIKNNDKHLLHIAEAAGRSTLNRKLLLQYVTPHVLESCMVKSSNEYMRGRIIRK